MKTTLLFTKKPPNTKNIIHNQIFKLDATPKEKDNKQSQKQRSQKTKIKRAGGLVVMTPPLQGGDRRFNSASAHAAFFFVKEICGKENTHFALQNAPLRVG